MTEKDSTNVVPANVTARADGIDHDVVAKTPAGMPNVAVSALQPVQIVFIRATRAYLQTLVGLLGAGGLGLASQALPFNNFKQLFFTSAGLAIGSAIISALQNTIELLAKVDESFPKVRG